jgi:predicted MFS family arabinose efflux permease
VGRKRLWAPLRVRNVRLLIAGTGLSQIGDWLYNVALIVFVFDRTGSAAWVAAAGIVRLVPYVLFGTIGGMIADRRPRRSTMIASDVIRAMVMFVMTVVVAHEGSPVFAVVLAGVATTFSVAYGPCVNAAIPRLVDEDDLSVVNTLSATVTNLSYALGPALGGVLLILGSPAAALAVNGFTFLLSAVLTAMIRGDLGPDADHVADVPIAEAVAVPSPGLVDGFHALTSSPFVVALVVTQVMTSVLYGMETVLYALASTDLLGIGVDGVAFLYAAIGVGGIAAAGIAQRLTGRSEAGVVLAVSAVLCGIPMATLAFVRVPSVAIAVLLVEGAAMIVLDVIAVTSLQRLLGADVLGRAFGALDSLAVAGILVGIVLAPVLVATVGLDAALLTGGALMLVSGAGVLVQARAIDRSIEAYAGPLRDRVSSLRRLAIFRGATRSTLEHVAEVLREEPVGQGVAVIRQGDPPDDLFVVIEGGLEVVAETSQGDHIVATLGPGDFFGEIGLLRQVSRTATVRTIEPTRLYRIPGQEFLDIVSQGAIRSRVLTRAAQSRLAALPLETRPATSEG